jgi:uncharacterized membrane protein
VTSGIFEVNVSLELLAQSISNIESDFCQLVPLNTLFTSPVSCKGYELLFALALLVECMAQACCHGTAVSRNALEKYNWTIFAVSQSPSRLGVVNKSSAGRVSRR